MNEKPSNFSPQDPKWILQSPQAQQLMQQLRQLDPELLHRAAALAAAGDSEGARALLAPRLRPEREDRDG